MTSPNMIRIATTETTVYRVDMTLDGIEAAAQTTLADLDGDLDALVARAWDDQWFQETVERHGEVIDTTTDARTLADLVHGTLNVGTHTPFAAICERLDAYTDQDKANVHAALTALVGQGRVSLRPGSGYVALPPVRPFTVIGLYEGGEAISVGVIEGEHQITDGNDEDERSPWADHIEARTAAEAEAIALAARNSDDDKED